MANGSGGRSANASQLRKDLAAGRPVPYRRLPGAAGIKGRKYYNPYNGDIVSEHYVIRVYRPNLSSLEREITAQSNRRNALNTRRQRKSIQETYLIKKQAENPGRTLAQLQTQYASEFQTLYRNLRVQQLAAKSAEIGSDERKNILAADGEYARTLEELGRRVPNQDFLVGMSPQVKGGYIDTVVVPYYNEIRGY